MKRLAELLRAAKIDTSDCLEKRDLVAKVTQFGLLPEEDKKRDSFASDDAEGAIAGHIEVLYFHFILFLVREESCVLLYQISQMHLIHNLSRQIRRGSWRPSSASKR